MKLYEHGVTAGVAPTANDHERAKRGNVCGWSHRSIRSNTLFLYSVLSSGLTGDGMALTLTVRRCPPSHREWQRMIRALTERLRRLGMLRLHWLTEWQRRRVPHLHCAVWFDTDDIWIREKVIDAWLEIAAPYEARRQSQTATPIHDAIGWFQYVSKHAARGLAHYQRSPELVPAGWQTTGRMWGYRGDWALVEPHRIELTAPAFHRLRRMVRGLRLADARAKGDRQRIVHARRMLSSANRGGSSTRGIRDWLEFDAALRFVALLESQGYRVEHAA